MGQDAELWQKPAAYVDCIDGTEGFLQMWLPTETDETGLVSVTAGDYDRDVILDAVQDDIRFGATTN